MTKKPKNLLTKCAVVAAILLLFGLFVVLPVAGMIFIKKAKMNAAYLMCVELEYAVGRFYEDNGKMPLEVDEDVSFSSSSEMGLDLLRVLMSQETVDPPLNEKGVKYLLFMTGHPANKHRLILGPSGELLGLQDPWGRPYMIALDGDFDGSISVKTKALSSAKILQRRVAVWSNGKNPDKVKDDVVTW